MMTPGVSAIRFRLRGQNREAAPRVDVLRSRGDPRGPFDDTFGQGL